MTKEGNKKKEDYKIVNLIILRELEDLAGGMLGSTKVLDSPSLPICYAGGFSGVF